MYRFYSIFLLFFFYVGSLQALHDQVVINVWIHGANHMPGLMLLQSKLSPLRPYLYVKSGLTLAKKLPEHYSLHQLAKCYEKANKDSFSTDTFFVYGWPAAMSFPRQLKHHGNMLFEKLNKLVDNIKTKYKQIKIRLIGFSHGGNIALYAARHLPFKADNIEVEMVFLGTPIQELSRSFVNSPFVKRAYSFYTSSDWIQGLELQKLYDFRSNTPFFTRKTFLHKDNVVQAELTINGSSFGHWQYHDMKNYLPHVLQAVDTAIINNTKQKHVKVDINTTIHQASIK